jgi:hypothetical protein
MDDSSFGDDSLRLEDYLQSLRNFKERVELTERHFVLSAEELAAKL